MKKITIKKKTGIIALVGIVLWCVFAYMYTLFSVPIERMVRGVVLIESDHQLMLCYGEDKTLALTGIEKTYCTGFFVSRGGDIETHWAHADDSVEALSKDSIRVLLTDLQARTTMRQGELDDMLDEMAYYDRTHTVVDDGYNQVMALHDVLMAEVDSLKLLQNALDEALKGDRFSLRFQRSLAVYYRPTLSDALQRFEAESIDESHCRLADGKLPEGAYVFNPTSMRWGNEQRWAIGYLVEPQKASDSLAFVPQIVNLDTIPASVPFPAVLSGAPVVDARAHIRAVCTPTGWVERGGYAFAPGAWWNSFRQWIGGWFGSSLPAASAPVAYVNRVGERPHEGFGTYTDSLGYTYVGVWEADTLPRGERWVGYRQSVFDTLRSECYVGDFDGQLRPSGEGKMMGASYYEGEWNEGVRHGFGIGITPGRIVSIGSWKKGKFMGEHIIYHADRVYGIDIARYQHEKGKRKYPIRWQDMRVTNLGTRTKKTVHGSTDYPVSFCYIKATQGVRTKSDYSTEDAFQARMAGIHVGHYHFFSPMGGKGQAEWFLQHASLKKGDLPPMLDVELTPKQIEQMGGAEVMLREMVEWIRVVKPRCGTQPVLYVNQNFVDTYMANAPEEVKACPVWVARYSQYRPYVRLVFWQLSDDGRVNGITPDVDIDVFNGSMEQFEDFVRENGVR
ncbi:MAG: hypothetical protein MJZ60_03550 [Bacteroidaceae bacterium]|nr:hypothetical protein [Bacteroidaceae bacterium]